MSVYIFQYQNCIVFSRVRKTEMCVNNKWKERFLIRVSCEMRWRILHNPFRCWHVSWCAYDRVKRLKLHFTTWPDVCLCVDAGHAHNAAQHRERSSVRFREKWEKLGRHQRRVLPDVLSCDAVLVEKYIRVRPHNRYTLWLTREFQGRIVVVTWLDSESFSKCYLGTFPPLIWLVNELEMNF